MTTSKSLPARPSLESLRKQAKKLARDITAGDAGAIARARLQLPHVDLPLTQRNAQLVIAREYGYAGWQDLTAEVSKRLGTDLERERWFTRAACAELLIDARAVVPPSVCEGLIESRAKGLLQLFHRKGLLPRTLKFFAALGDLDAVRVHLDENENDLATINEAFVCACRFEHEAVASLLLERSIALDPELGKHIDGSTDRVSFIRCFT